MLPALIDSSKACPCVATRFQSPKDGRFSSEQRKGPFTKILRNKWIHTVDLLLPSEASSVVREKIEALSMNFSFSRVSMSLLEVISGDFFNYYIKTGSVMMISQGRPLIDNRYTLREGLLRLEINKPTYERCGLVGEPVKGLGSIHKKLRYAIETDLRQSCMVPGKKGFERLVWAFTKVLSEPVTWLFVDLSPGEKSPIKEMDPTDMSLSPIQTSISNLQVPFVPSSPVLEDKLYQEQLLEWIGLVLIDSPRVLANDSIDPFLCRYMLPEAFEPESPSFTSLLHYRWHGLVSTRFVRELLKLLEPEIGESACVLGNAGFDGGSSYCMYNSAHALTWEISS